MGLTLANPYQQVSWTLASPHQQVGWTWWTCWIIITSVKFKHWDPQIDQPWKICGDLHPSCYKPIMHCDVWHVQCWNTTTNDPPPPPKEGEIWIYFHLTLIVNGCREFKIQCRGVGVLPPLELSSQIIHFSATALNDVSMASVHVVNSHTSTNEFTHPVPRIGKGGGLIRARQVLWI